MENLLRLQKSVVRVDTSENANMIKYMPKEQRQKLDPNIQVVSSDYVTELRKNKTISIPTRIDIGDILVLHPFVPNKYVLIQNLIDETYGTLYSCISGIARCLGATMIEWSKSVSILGERTLDGEGKLQIGPYAQLTANAHSNDMVSHQSEESKKNFFITDGVLSLEEKKEDYVRACQKAEEYGLADHNDIKELLEGRNPNNKRQILTKEVTLHMISQINNSFDAAFTLTSLGEVFSIGASVKDIIKKCQDIEYKYVIHFEEILPLDSISKIEPPSE
ncbi:MAG: hypothetical protein KBT20_06135 [Bacteroidales bacterium]|nr:hypothetical protein [Candidatus Liminaster caballi]